MSEKELLYVDDTLGHLEQFSAFLNEYVIDVENEEFKEIIEDILKVNNIIYDEFYKLNCK